MKICLKNLEVTIKETSNIITLREKKKEEEEEEQAGEGGGGEGETLGWHVPRTQAGRDEIWLSGYLKWGLFLGSGDWSADCRLV